jgi:hypothetical protein
MEKSFVVQTPRDDVVKRFVFNAESAASIVFIRG